MEKWLREKRAGGWANLGFLHLIIAAYVRTVSMRPGVNRFVSGRRIYARNDIEVILPVKRFVLLIEKLFASNFLALPSRKFSANRFPNALAKFFALYPLTGI